VVYGRQAREGDEPQAALESSEQSDEVVVPEKSAKTRVTPVESMEGRTEAKGKSAARNAHPAQDGVSALTVLQRIGQKAKEKKRERFTNLLSHVKVPLLKGGVSASAERRGIGRGCDDVERVRHDAR
jgi:hypothetical protein